MRMKRRVPIIITAMLLSLLGLGYYLNIMLIPELKNTQIELQDKKAMLAARDQELASVQELEKRFESIQLQASRAIAALPSEKQVPEILYKLTSIADEQGLVTTNLSVSPTVVANRKGNVSSVEFNLAFSGSYNEIIGYLDKVETSLRLLSISSVSIGGGSSLSAGDGANSPQTLLTASVKGQAYFTAEKAAPRAPAPAAPSPEEE